MSNYTAEQVEACVRGMELDGIVRLMLLDHAADLRKGKSEYEKDMEDTLSQIAEAVGFTMTLDKTADDLITHIKEREAVKERSILTTSEGFQIPIIKSGDGYIFDSVLGMSMVKVPKEMVEGDARNPYSDQLIHYGYTAGFNKCRELMLSDANKSVD